METSREILTELFTTMLGLRSAVGVERVVPSALQDRCSPLESLACSQLLALSPRISLTHGERTAFILDSSSAFFALRAPTVVLLKFSS
jgi:hypothetical protein